MKTKPVVFTEHFYSICDQLASADPDLQAILSSYGYPPLWSRTPSFKTLIHFILEQQVSLASAKAALLKLEDRLGNVTPENLLLLTDEELKACYFSRQKITYARCLANAVVEKQFCFTKMAEMEDELVRIELKKVKGVGDWTADVFLMMALHRCDLFPTGDVALMKSIRQVKTLPDSAGKEEVLRVAGKWKPYRTVAAYLLWHAYLEKRKLPRTVVR